MRRGSTPGRVSVALAALAVLSLLCIAPARSRADDAGKPLAYELAQLREAWINGDDATVAARLDALRTDNRIEGELARWYNHLRAWVALEQGDLKTAQAGFDAQLKGATDAREYVRAARLLLLFGERDVALAVVGRGIVLEPRSRALQRVQAGLHWIGGDHEAALGVYTQIFVDASVPMYPYVSPTRSRWSGATKWGAEPAPAPDGEEKPEPKPEEEPKEKPPEWSEPYVSLFPPLHWYDTDLPGLDRCLAEMATDANTAAAEEAALPERLAAARAARDKVNRLRTGDTAEREKQERAAKAAEFRAVCGARVVATSQLANANPQDAEKTARDLLELVPGEIALLDLLAQALARQARAEELRNGPLSSLRTLANLYVGTEIVLDPGPAREGADRVFEGALNLYRINKVTGRAQFDHLVRTFGQRGRGRGESVQPGALGLWLYMKGEHELARVYLREGSRAQGFQSGRQMLPDAQPAELVMLALGEGKDAPDKPDEKKEGEEDDKKDDEPVQPADDGEEPVEGIKVGGFEGDAHPLLRMVPRAGALSAALYDTRGAVQRVTGVQSYYGSNYGSRALAAALPMLPRGEETLQQAMYGLPARIAQDVPAKDLEAALAEDSPQTTNLKGTLTAFGDSLRSLQSNRDWQTMRAVAQRTEAVFGMIEAYALLVRARVLRDKPKDLKALSELLAKHQPAMDLRKAANATSDELYVRMDRERRDAGYPEVVNSGLLLDAAMLLADAGKPLEGAKLIWHNRDVATGLNTLESIAFVGSVLAARGGDALLSARCRLISTAGPPQTGRQATYRDPMLRALELPYALAQLRKVGSEEDVVRYLELHVLGDLPGETMARVREVVPELEGVQPARTATINAGTMIESAVGQGGCWTLRDNWHRVLAVKDGGRTASRLAAWTLVSDLPLSRSYGQYAGLADAADTMLGWVMLLQHIEVQGAESPGARTRAVKLRRLIQRCASPTSEIVKLHPTLFGG